MKKVAIIQPNYIPWKGYFDIIDYVDEFVLLDDVQYTKRDWRNRNLIKGEQWLTVPVKTKSAYNQLIKDVEIDGMEWRKNHFQTLSHTYSKEKGFSLFESTFKQLYDKKYQFLIDVQIAFLTEINAILGIDTKLSLSSDFKTKGVKTEKLLNVCRKIGTNIYVSGDKAKNYLNEESFYNEKINIEWFKYDKSLKSNSILDFLFVNGEEAINFYKK